MIDPQRIWTSNRLPTLPSVAIRLLELTKNPDSEIRDVIAAVKADPAISAKLIKAANSSLFGVRCEVKSVDRAVPLIGTTVATSMALSFSLTDATFSRGPLRDHYQAYWRQSLIHAVAAEILAKRTAPHESGDYFLCGLLLDLGQLAILKAIGPEYAPVLESATADGLALHEREAQQLGFTHVEIGSKLMEHWKLPDAMIDAVRQHHAPVEQLLVQPERRLTLAAAVAASVGDYFCAAAKGAALARLQSLAKHALQLYGEELDEFLTQCETRAREASPLFDVDLSTLGSSAELILQANEQLAQLALKEHVASTQATVRQQMVEQENQQLETRNHELQKRALHDPLTGVYNRAFFDESLSREAFRCQREAAPIAVLFVDIDHFKVVNDTLGHAMGDQVLRHIALTLQETLRESDILARFGGEEFVVLVHQPAEKGLQKLAERVRAAIAGAPFRYGEQSIPATCSVGCAIALPGRKERDVGAKLLAAADECLYEAKRSGRNQTAFRSLVSEADHTLQQLVTAQRFSRWLVNEKLLDIASVSRALVHCPPQTTRLGELGLDAGYLSTEQVQAIIGEQEDSGDRFGVVAVRQGVLTQSLLAQLLALQYENPKRLAASIIRLGLMSPEQTMAALERYSDLHLPQSAVALV
ncbi:MAG: GGDEF domain-containing protein [Planctomycetaceae bacterium]|nr:GGDEF domain-containing protein [Planctomycetaceae bacterium]